MASVTLPPDPTGFTDIGSIIHKALPYVYVIAGLALLFMLISGGITLMTAAGDPGKSKEGYGKITAGLIGFVIIFVAYFVMQIVSTVLGVTIF
jgi:hypothetical protein